MATTKPTIVFILGGFSLPSHYAKLTAALTSAGFETHCPPLPSAEQISPPVANLTTDSALIRAFVLDLLNAGKTVVVMMHSYGGQVGTNCLSDLSLSTRSAAGLPGGVSLLIYMSAAAMNTGECMMDTFKANGMEHLIPVVYNFFDDGMATLNGARDMMFGHAAAAEGDGDGKVTDEASEEEKHAYIDSMVKWNASKCIYDKLEHCAWREVPPAWIFFTRDNAIPLAFQQQFKKGMEEVLGREVPVVEMAACHCANLTNPGGVVKAVERLLAM
jgi:pimeloyl-ACP methyl ester carboxylesterase